MGRRGRIDRDSEFLANIPMRFCGPLKLSGAVNDEIMVPLATYETPLWPSVNRGASVSSAAGGIKTTVVDERMSRSILLEAESAEAAFQAVQSFQSREAEIRQTLESSSRFAKLIELNYRFVANLIYIRIEMNTADASGHNMVTLAADTLMHWLLKKYSDLKYVSVSGNYCTDKKVSAVNSIQGRGKNVIAETLIPARLCKRFLKSTATEIADLNLKKNLIGSIISGSLCSANAHFANMLLAFYLATGQDAANIVEGSQGIVHCENREGDLYFSCTLPNLIVGTVGNGKGLDFVRNNLEKMNCLSTDNPGESSRKLAAIAAAVALCGELSLLAALTNPGELMDSHQKLERQSDND